MPEALAERSAEPLAEARRTTAEPQRHALAEVVEHGGVYGEFRELLAASGRAEPPPESIASVLAKPEYESAVNAAQKARVVGEVQQRYGNAYAQRVVAAVRRLSAARPQSALETVPSNESASRLLPFRRNEAARPASARARTERNGTEASVDAETRAKTETRTRDQSQRDTQTRTAATPRAAENQNATATQNSNIAPTPTTTRTPASRAASPVAAPTTTGSVAAARTGVGEASQSESAVTPEAVSGTQAAAASESAPGSGGTNEAAPQTDAVPQTTSPALSPNAAAPAPLSQTATPAPPTTTISNNAAAPAAPGGRPRASVPPTGGAARSRPASAMDAAASSPQGAVPSLAPPNAGMASVAGAGTTPTPIPMAGASEEVMQNFTSSGASQIAATLPVIGDALAQRVAEEQQATVENIPPIKAQTSGVAEPPALDAPPPPTSPGVQISEGTTEGEPPPPRVEPHQDTAPPPRNAEQTRAVEQQSDEGFFSWLRDSFNDLMGSISTHDSGVNTDAGERPQFDTSGEADPARATRQHAEGTAQVGAQQQEVAAQIANHPGQQQIQPLAVDEETRVAISQTSQAINTQATDEMAQYASMPIPGDVRQNADQQLAPMLEQSLAAPRQEVERAAARRNQEQQTAIETTQQQAAELNQQAEREQTDVVQQSRQEVSGEQQRGLQESRQRMEAFNAESNEQQTATVRDVNQRVETDQQQANRSLTDAERDAEAERRRGEEQAAARKRELERESENDSWWDRAVDAVKSAVKAVTDAIDAVFTAVRNAVKNILDAAKNFAVGLIEAGRRWVVDKIQSFGNWLKSKVTEYLSAFPALAAAINSAIDRTVNAAVQAVNAIADRLKAGVTALVDALGRAIDAALSFYQNALKGAVALVGAVLTGDFAAAARMVFMAACSALGIDAGRLLEILGKAGDALSLIFKDPIGFLGNLVGAVRQGFEQFMTNILRHLASGLMGWLFGALEGAGIQLPSEFTLKAIFGLVMQVLGVTYDRIRAKIVRLIGERAVDVIERVWGFVSTLISEGPAGLWEEIKEYLGDLKDVIFDAIKDWVVTKIVQAAVTKLVTMFNPVGAIVQAVLAIYNTVMFFIERINQIIALVESVVNSIYKIATGAIGDAANWVESAMARTIPVIISFLARLIGLGGISEKIRNIIEGIQERVDRAIDMVIQKIARGITGLVSAGRAAVGRVIAWWRQRKQFTTESGERHTLYFQGEGGSSRLVMASEIKDVQEVIDERLAKRIKATERAALGRANTILINIRTLMRDNATSTQQTRPPATPASTDVSEQIGAHLNDLATALREGGVGVGDKPLTRVTWSMDGNRAGYVLAQPLTKNAGNTAGSRPGVDPPGWNQVIGFDYTEVREGSGVMQPRYWRRMHLLNEELHGPGERWNLTPGREVDNTWMKNNPEKDAKAALEEEPGVLFYEVTVSYYDDDAAISNFPKEVAVNWGTMKQQGETWVRDERKGTSPHPLDPPPRTLSEAAVVNLKNAGRVALERLGVARRLRRPMIEERNKNGDFNGFADFENRMKPYFPEEEWNAEHKPFVQGLISDGRARF